MMQKRLYIGQFNRAGELIAVASVYTLPYKNKRLIPPNTQRISKAEHDTIRRLSKETK